MFWSVTDWVEAPRGAPKGVGLFAIGDVHGCLDELRALRRVIGALAKSGSDDRDQLVYLGDYVDRGPHSKGVLELLSAGTDRAVTDRAVDEHFLVGNHDQYLVELLDPGGRVDRELILNWFVNGGEATLTSLGVKDYGRALDAGHVGRIGDGVRAALGEDLIRFLRGLQTSVRFGDYLFVHAGIDPALELDEQDPIEMMWIREPFLSARGGWRHEFVVVHGHTIDRPVVLSHRIGVDVGCFLRGVLCAVEIRGAKLRFIGVTAQEDYPWSVGMRSESTALTWSALQPVQESTLPFALRPHPPDR